MMRRRRLLSHGVRFDLSEYFRLLDLLRQL
jgi:hypothetical protein